MFFNGDVVKIKNSYTTTFTVIGVIAAGTTESVVILYSKERSDFLIRSKILAGDTIAIAGCEKLGLDWKTQRVTYVYASDLELAESSPFCRLYEIDGTLLLGE